MAFSDVESPATRLPTWEARAVARSLADARKRSGDQARALVDAARRLAASTGALDFTVGDVVADAAVSLKTFYRLFGSKEELLLAIFEEDNRIGAERLGAIVDAETEPTERLRTAVTGLFGFLEDERGRPYMAVLVREHLRLSATRPHDLNRALAPYIDLVDRELAAAAGAGAIRAPESRDAQAILHLILGHMHTLILVGADDPDATADYVWRFVINALKGEHK